MVSKIDFYLIIFFNDFMSQLPFNNTSFRTQFESIKNALVFKSFERN